MQLSVVQPAGPGDLLGLLDDVVAGRSALGVSAPTQDPAVLLPEQPAEPGVVLATSGSTGSPKAVTLAASALRASAEATQAHLGVATDWVCALPVHHIAGLMTLVRARLAGTTVIPTSARLTDLAIPRRPTAISLVPTQLVRALERPALVAALAAHAAVLVGGAASDPAVLVRAREAGIAVVTTYGMTETCGGCVYDGQPLAGVEIDVDADQRILIGGPTLMSGYRGDPELTAEVLVDGWVRTQDRGRWEAGRLDVLGRLDEVVITGGVNVDLADVERAVAALEAEAVVVGVPDPEWGAVITIVSTRPADLSAWQDRLRDRLASEALPRRIEVVDTLPLTSSGKVDRPRLVTELAARNTDDQETRGHTR